jgi:hypothetical protein
MTFNRAQQTRLLYLITALLLFMQSLTLWHDVEHPFHGHEHDIQCERFEAYANSPTLDNTASLSVITSADISELISSLSIALIINNQRDTYAIRAPPTFLS